MNIDICATVRKKGCLPHAYVNLECKRRLSTASPINPAVASTGMCSAGVNRCAPRARQGGNPLMLVGISTVVGTFAVRPLRGA